MAGLAVKVYGAELVQVPIGDIAKEFCTCDFWCEYREQVFASPGNNDHRNDKTSFLVSKLAVADTIVIKLFKNGEELTTITDNSLGVYYSTFAAQPLYVGWVADWTLIFNVHGGGTYHVEIEATLAGSTVTMTSRKFLLNLYDINLANRTVRIESYHDSNIPAEPLDFTGLIDGGWYSSIRVNADFVGRTPTLEVDEYLDTSYKSNQNRSQVTNTYGVTIRNCPQSVFDIISQTYILGNRILLSNFYSLADVLYQRIEVVAESIDDVDHQSNGRGTYSITFKDRVQNRFTRNF